MMECDALGGMRSGRVARGNINGGYEDTLGIERMDGFMETDVKMKVAKGVRVITVAPVVALVTLILLYLVRPLIFGGIFQLLMAILFLTVLPLLAYPLQRVLPGFRDRGRDGQRKLAFIMAVAGYVCGTVFAVAADAPKGVFQIYLTYLISGVILSIFNKLLKIKASGHACGVAGPVALLVHFCGINGYWALLILPVVYWACLAMKRHTPSQLLLGTITPLISLVLVLLIF